MVCGARNALWDVSTVPLISTSLHLRIISGTDAVVPYSGRQTCRPGWVVAVLDKCNTGVALL